MRFWPDFFVEGAIFCYDNKTDQEGDKLLKEGTSANPENPILALFQADRIENTTTSNGQGDEGIIRRGAEVRAPYEQVHNALYDLLNRAKERETKEQNQINESYENEEYTPAGIQNDFDADDDEQDQKAKQREAEKQAALEAVNKNVTEEIKYLSRVISFVLGLPFTSDAARPGPRKNQGYGWRDTTSRH